MLVLYEKDLQQAGIDWHQTIAVIEDAVQCLADGDFAQPVKPYLRYRNRKNRIIAMPAFTGGKINMAGIKWIASFPGNIDKGLARAHSVVILNDADTGEPVAIICTALLSIIRTASVSGLVLKHYLAARPYRSVKIGITGFGPIGRQHLEMCRALLGDRIERIAIYDIRPVDLSSLGAAGKEEEVVATWEEAYLDADVFITCTVSDAPYIDKPPKPGSLHLNVSLRDYTVNAYDWFRTALFVDDWEEVCRERTDIELMHLEKGLQRVDTQSIVQIVREEALAAVDAAVPILFNPMGMAIFDIAIGNYYYRAAQVAQATPLEVMLP